MCDTTARLDGKTAIITGGSSGLGLEAAKTLASKGARVIIASRNETKLKAAKEHIQKSTGSNNVDYGILDFASFKSVRNFVSDTVNSEAQINILINNAGAVALPDRVTEDGLNLTMQVNYFGAFLLTYLLLPLLKKSSPSRIIIVTGASMYLGNIDFDHWNDVGRYSWVESLANSKFADALFTAELSRRLQGSNVTINNFDPFLVRGTNLLSDTSGSIYEIAKQIYNTLGRFKEDVGREMAYFAAEPSLAKVSGANFKFCSIWPNHWSATDEDLTAKFWELSKNAVKISENENWEENVIQ